jgi:hypothetical protein
MSKLYQNLTLGFVPYGPLLIPVQISPYFLANPSIGCARAFCGGM